MFGIERLRAQRFICAFCCSTTVPGKAAPHRAKRCGWKLSFREAGTSIRHTPSGHLLLFSLARLSCGSLAHYFSLRVSVPFFLPSPRPRPPWVYLWSGLARPSCTGVNRTQLLSSGCAARSFGAPRTRVGKEGDSLAASPGQASPGLASVLLLPLWNAQERNGRSVGRGAAGIRKGEGGDTGG